MKKTELLGCTPHHVASRGRKWEERECSALIQQIIDHVGTPPGSSTFVLAQTYRVGSSHSVSSAYTVTPSALVRTEAGIMYHSNDTESVEYVLEVQNYLDSVGKWTQDSLRELGPSYV